MRRAARLTENPMTTTRNTISLIALLALVAALPALAQNRTQFGGRYNAATYAFGVHPNVQPLYLDSPSGAAYGTGSVTFTVQIGSVTDRKSTRLNSSHVRISY